MTHVIQFREAFARRLIRLRKEKKETQKQVAEAIKLKHRTYAAYEERRSAPSMAVMRRLADHYGLTLDQLANVENANF